MASCGPVGGAGETQKYQFLKKGVDLVSKAVEQDKKDNYLVALKLYKDGIQCFLNAKQNECTSDKDKNMVDQKIDSYQKRVDVLQEFFENLEIEDEDEQNENPEANRSERKKDETKDSTRYEKELLKSVLLDNEKLPLSEVVGLTEIKEELEELIITPDRNLHLCTGGRARDCSPILLYGAPGCGKTYLARAVGSQLQNSKFLHVTGSDFISRWLGDGIKLTAELFSYAKKIQPCVLFIDDLDVMTSIYLSSDRAEEIRTELLYHLEDYRKSGIQVLAAATTPWKIDEAVRQRFSKSIYVPLPDLEARADMIELFFSGTKHSFSEEDFQVIAEKTEGFTGADISILVRDAFMAPVRKVQSATHFCKVSAPSAENPDIMIDDFLVPCQPDAKNAIQMNWQQLPIDKLLEPTVTMEDLMGSLNNTKATVSEEDLQEYLQFREQLGT